MNEPQTPTVDQLLTLGQIAKRLGVSTHRLKYAIDQYHVEHVTRIGITRVWTEADLPRSRLALARVAANRSANPPVESCESASHAKDCGAGLG